MESCSQDHFKIFPEAVHFLLLQCCWPRRIVQYSRSPGLTLLTHSLPLFCFCYAIGVTNNPSGSMRAVFSSCSLCVVYGGMWSYCCPEGLLARQGWGWGERWGRGTALTFFLKVVLLALQVHWAQCLYWSLMQHIRVFPELPRNGFDGNSWKQVRFQK